MVDYSPNASVVFRKDLTDFLCIMRVTPDSQEIPAFEPGQYAELAIPEIPVEGREEGPATRKLVRRAYSICSAPSQRDSLEFFIALVGHGRLTPRLWMEEEGGRVWLGPKIKGTFTLQDVPAGHDLLMVATGTGVAPFVSMLREFHGNGRWRRAALIHGCRYAADLGYVEEMTALAAADPTFHYIPMVTREPEGSPWPGRRGRVLTLFQQEDFLPLAGFPLDPQSTQILLCGNPEMIDSVQHLLSPRGFRVHTKKEPGNIHFERYW